MEIFSTIKETKDCLKNLKKEVRQGADLQNRGKKVGFAPTMGALHRGHTSLLERAKRENDIAVSSIFVNPLQFNDKKDLEKYPRTWDQDVEKLKLAHCDVLFAPSSEEMYPESSSNSDSPIRPLSGSQETEKRGRGEAEKNKQFDLGNLDKVMEGKLRPGHFQGVCVVVKKLFDIIEPDKAYFGEKDFQQLAIIKHMVKTLKIPVEIISCPTVRESDGLAMSSRNMRLNSDERKNAAHIYKTMVEAKTSPRPSPKGEGGTTIAALRKWVEEKINENPFLQLEYYEIVNSDTLQPVQNWEEAQNLRACIAVKVGAVRLIDNIPM